MALHPRIYRSEELSKLTHSEVRQLTRATVDILCRETDTLPVTFTAEAPIEESFMDVFYLVGVVCDQEDQYPFGFLEPDAEEEAIDTLFETINRDLAPQLPPGWSAEAMDINSFFDAVEDGNRFLAVQEGAISLNEFLQQHPLNHAEISTDLVPSADGNQVRVELHDSKGAIEMVVDRRPRQTTEELQDEIKEILELEDLEHTLTPKIKPSSFMVPGSGSIH